MSTSTWRPHKHTNTKKDYLDHKRVCLYVEKNKVMPNLKLKWGKRKIKTDDLHLQLRKNHNRYTTTNTPNIQHHKHQHLEQTRTHKKTWTRHQ